MQEIFEVKDDIQYSSVHSLSLSPDGKHLAFGCHYKVYLIDLNGNLVRTYRINRGILQNLRIKWALNSKLFACMEVGPMHNEFKNINSTKKLFWMDINQDEEILVGTAKYFSWSQIASDLIFWNNEGCFYYSTNANIRTTILPLGELSPDSSMVALTDPNSSIAVLSSKGKTIANPNIDWFSGDTGWSVFAYEFFWADNNNELLYSQASDAERIFLIDLKDKRIQLIGEGMNPKYSFPSNLIGGIKRHYGLNIYQRDGNIVKTIEGISHYDFFSLESKVIYTQDKKIFVEKI